MDISLNYTELAFIMGLKRQWCKLAFMKILNTQELSTNQEIEVEKLCSLFNPIKSVDKRFDGMNELHFNLQIKSSLYKEELTRKSALRYQKFTGAKTIFYKICSPEQLEHARITLEANKQITQLKINYDGQII